MAFGAKLYVDVFFGGTGLPYSTAGAGDGGGLVVRMNSFFHLCHLFLYRAYSAIFYDNIGIITQTKAECNSFFSENFALGKIFDQKEQRKDSVRAQRL